MEVRHHEACWICETDALIEKRRHTLKEAAKAREAAEEISHADPSLQKLMQQLAELEQRLLTTRRELERWKKWQQVEGDYICEDGSIARDPHALEKRIAYLTHTNQVLSEALKRLIELQQDA